ILQQYALIVVCFANFLKKHTARIAATGESGLSRQRKCRTGATFSWPSCRLNKKLSGRVIAGQASPALAVVKKRGPRIEI
ncbi:hypothetical protein M1O56_05740, partial [Dehalococcoidia bacterium]|nr:hypothetical protein [Dehalococcoidia bacterium]